MASLLGMRQSIAGDVWLCGDSPSLGLTVSRPAGRAAASGTRHQAVVIAGLRSTQEQAACEWVLQITVTGQRHAPRPQPVNVESLTHLETAVQLDARPQKVYVNWILSLPTSGIRSF